MEAFRDDSFKLKKHTKTLILILMIFVIVIGGTTFYKFRSSVETSIKGQAESALKSVSAQNVKLVDTRIFDRIQYLRSIAKEIARRKETDTEKIVESLRLYRGTYQFYNMGVIDKNGICRTTQEEVLDLSEYSYFEEGFEGNTVVSEAYESEDGRHGLNIFTVPVVMDGEVVMTLTATYKSETFLEMTNILSFDRNGGSLVLNRTGESVSPVFQEELREGSTREMAKELSDHSADLVKCMEAGGGFVEYEHDGKGYLAYCQKMGTNDWYLLTYVPSEYIYQNSAKINETVAWLLVGLYLVIAVITLMFIFIYQKFQRQIMTEVYVDEITGKKNYRYFRLLFPSMSEEEKKGLYFVNFDVDKFKMINLIYGPEVGDELLRSIDKVFRKILPDDLIFRYHSDVFVAIVRAEDKEELETKLMSFQKALDAKLTHSRIREVTLSFGACALSRFDHVRTIYSSAVLAKNNIKGSLTEKCRMYNDTLKQQIEFRSIEMAFKDALKNGEFKVWYQPKYDMRTREIIGAEALVRWQKPNGTLVSPGQFIPVVENTGQIVELDEEVIRNVCKDLREALDHGIPVKKVSVNLSKMHLVRTGIAKKIERMVKQYKISPELLAFEITESVSFDDKKMMDAMIETLHKMGFTIDMDDYGTGSSTLRSLSDTQFDTIKLDKSFVDLIGNEKMNVIIESTIDMAKNLNMKIVAEGVEKKEQVDFLVEHRCYVAQGYYFSKPIPKDAYFKEIAEK